MKYKVKIGICPFSLLALPLERQIVLTIVSKNKIVSEILGDAR